MERQDQQLQQLTLTVNININDIRDLFSHLNGKPFHLSVSSESEATRLLPPMGYLLISIDNEEILQASQLIGASQVALVVKNLPANAGDIRDMGLILGSGRFP